MGEASSHRQHSQDAPAHLQPLCLWPCLRFSALSARGVAAPSDGIAVQGVAIGTNRRFLREVPCQVGFFPPMLAGSAQQPCTLSLC